MCRLMLKVVGREGELRTWYSLSQRNWTVLWDCVVVGRQ